MTDQKTNQQTDQIVLNAVQAANADHYVQIGLKAAKSLKRNNDTALANWHKIGHAVVRIKEQVAEQSGTENPSPNKFHRAAAEVFGNLLSQEERNAAEWYAIAKDKDEIKPEDEERAFTPRTVRNRVTNRVKAEKKNANNTEVVDPDQGQGDQGQQSAPADNPDQGVKRVDPTTVQATGESEPEADQGPDKETLKRALRDIGESDGETLRAAFADLSQGDQDALRERLAEIAGEPTQAAKAA